MGQSRMAQISYVLRHTLIAAAVLSTLASRVRTQTKGEFFGPPTPLIFDAQGARHWCLYGYDGPFTPPLVPNDSNIVSCRGNAVIQSAATLKNKTR